MNQVVEILFGIKLVTHDEQTFSCFEEVDYGIVLKRDEEALTNKYAKKKGYSRGSA